MGASSSDPRAGMVLAGYRIISELGRGGMGVVYLAEHLHLGRKVALKLLDERLSADERFRARFVRESQLAASIDHRNVIPIHDAGESDGLLYIAMHLIEGVDLASLIARQGRLEPKETIAILAQVADALDAAHRLGLVHRDVKPANVLLSLAKETMGHVYLTDFGLTKRADSASGITGTGVAVGTLSYMAPEHFQGQAADPRSDIYSLGCVLHECLTGSVPFDRDTQAAVMHAHLREPVPLVSASRPELGTFFDGIVARAMAKSRDDRFPTARALIDAALHGERFEATAAMSDASSYTGVIEPRQQARTGGGAHHFPAHTTSFVGRQPELEELTSLVPASRLSTLTGPGGSGKTRLACAIAERIADRFDDGAWFVDLAPVTEPALVGSVLVSALNLASTTSDLRESLRAALADSERLIVLDNCEQVLAASADLVAELLAACPGVAILATSREALGVTGEIVWAVPAMQVPPRTAEPRELIAYDAVRLFGDRASMVDRRYELTPTNAEGVVRVIERLDGIPLALELAATWTRVLSPDEIASKLDDRFRLLTRGPADAPARHRTLRAVIDWSYELLPESHRNVFGALSVFRGGFTLAAAEAVCAEDAKELDVLDALHGLVEANLVVADTSGETSRYTMLETIREYASETLAEDRQHALRDRHLEWFRSFAKRENAALSGESDELWHMRFDEDHDNIREALRWSLDGRRADEGLELAGFTAGYWFLRSNLVEGRSWLMQLLEAAERTNSEAVTDDRLRATLANGHHELARMAIGIGDYAAAQTAMTQAAELMEDAQATHENIKLHASVLEGLAQLSMNDGRLDDARAQCERSVEMLRSIGERLNEGRALTVLGLIHVQQGDVAAGRSRVEESMDILRDAGDAVGVANATIALGDVLLVAADLAAAKRAFEQALALCRDVASFGGVAYAWHKLGTIAAEEGDLSNAVALTEKALTQYVELGLGELAARMALWIGLYTFRAGLRARAATSYLNAIELDATGVGPWALEGLAEVVAASGHASEAAQLLGTASVVRETSGRPPDADDLDMIARATALATERDGEAAFARAFSIGRVTPFAESVEMATALTSGLTDTDAAHADTDADARGPRFVREGEIWVVEFEGRTIRLRDSKGMQHIAALVSSPHTEIHVLDLIAGPGARGPVSPGPGGSPAVGGADAGEVLDAEARKAYERRIVELQEEIEEAESYGDQGRATRLRAEFDILVDELRRATGLGGRPRKAASETERARLNVQRTIRAAIKRALEADRALGRFLDTTIRTGTFCSYEP